MPKFAPSPYQQAILDFVRDGRGNAVVIAVAGSGKTTTIMESLRGINPAKHVRLFAFNTTIAAELKQRILDLEQDLGTSLRNFQAGTFHSVCFGAVCRYLGKKPQDVKTDGRKLWHYCAQGFLNEEDAELYTDFICRLVGLAKGEGVGALVPDTEDIWWKLIQHHDLYLDSEMADEETAVKLARSLLRESNKLAKEQAWIDFDDQLYLVCLWKLRLWQNDFVFVDEAQDTNPVRRAIIKLALKPNGGRMIAVGDPRQAIYGFTGASHDAIDLIKQQFSAIELPLSVSYRCARAVVAQAQSIVPYIEPSPTAPEGSVTDQHVLTTLKTLTSKDVILCRNTAPLVETAYALISRGTGARILGKEIGSGLINLVKRLKAKNVDDLETRLLKFRDREVAKFTARGEEQKAEQVQDRVSCLMVVMDNLKENERTLSTLVKKLESMFSDDASGVTLCTAHKSKGKEWDTVCILRPELMPSSWARQDWQQQQEQNLMYVAWTRAKQKLVFLTGKMSDNLPAEKAAANVEGRCQHDWKTDKSGLIDICNTCGAERA